MINTLLLNGPIDTSLILTILFPFRKTSSKPRLRLPSSLRTDARIPPHLLLLRLRIPHWPFGRYGIFIAENEDILVLGEVAI